MTYEQTKAKINKDRLLLKHQYSKAKDSNERQFLLNKAKVLLIESIEKSLYSYWQGTPWDFNGTTTQPKKGAIACGYFVTTLLQDAGYKLGRTKLSTCPSFIMMKELTSASAIKNLNALTYEKFNTWLMSQPDELFIVGLDFHTGFVINTEGNVWFMHSNYITKAGVMKEKVIESSALKASKTRYIVCLTTNENFLRHWLFG